MDVSCIVISTPVNRDILCGANFVHQNVSELLRQANVRQNVANNSVRSLQMCNTNYINDNELSMIINLQ